MVAPMPRSRSPPGCNLANMRGWQCPGTPPITRRLHGCTFVQDRAGADRAKAELNGVLLHDLELKIGWGKAIAIPPAPLYTAASVFAGSAVATSGKGAGGAAVPPPGVDAAPPWVAPVHGSDDMLEGVGVSPADRCGLLWFMWQRPPTPSLPQLSILESLHPRVVPSQCSAANLHCVQPLVPCARHGQPLHARKRRYSCGRAVKHDQRCLRCVMQAQTW